MTCKPGASISAGWFGPNFNVSYMAPTGYNSLSIPEIHLAEVLETGKFKGQDFPIKSLLLWGSSLIGGSVDTSRVIRSFENVDFIVGIDMAFSDQLKYVDIALPCGHPYEIQDILFMGPWAIYDERVIEPLYECKADGEIARLFGVTFGYGELFDKTDEDFAREALDSDAMRALGLTWENITAQRAIRWLPEGYVPEPVFQTETTRMEFYVDAPFPRLDYGQQIDFDAEHLPYWFPPTEAWHEKEIMKEYPLIFMSERARNRYHTQDFESLWLLETESEPIIRINPIDAEARGISENDYVEVFNSRSSCVVRARLSSALKPGTVIYPKGWQMSQFKKGCWGALHNGEFDPVGVNSSYYDSVCEIRKWDEEA